jgi:hypothetical protein
MLFLIASTTFHTNIAAEMNPADREMFRVTETREGVSEITMNSNTSSKIDVD